LKSRPDWLPRDPKARFVVDYKTAVSIEPRKLSGDVFKFCYHLQAAMQIDAVREHFNIEPKGIAHVIQEKEPPFLCCLRMFTNEQLDYGRAKYQKAVETFARCLDSGKWPGYADDAAQYFETPRWVDYDPEG